MVVFCGCFLWLFFVDVFCGCFLWLFLMLLLMFMLLFLADRHVVTVVETDNAIKLWCLFKSVMVCVSCVFWLNIGGCC